MVRPTGGAPRIGTHAIDWIMSWCTLTASARRSSSRALIVTTGSPPSTTARRRCARSARAGRRRPAPVRAVMRLELALLAHEQDEPALGAEERHRVVGHALQQARHVVLARELPGDLEDAREAILGRPAEGRGPRPLAGAATRPSRRDGAADGRRVRLPERPAARVVPEHLAQVAGELRRRLLEHREGGLGVAPRGGEAALRGGQPRPCVERLPRPFAAPALERERDRGVERRAAPPPRRPATWAIAPRTSSASAACSPSPARRAADLRRARPRAHGRRRRARGPGREGPRGAIRRRRARAPAPPRRARPPRRRAPRCRPDRCPRCARRARPRARGAARARPAESCSRLSVSASIEPRARAHRPR